MKKIPKTQSAREALSAKWLVQLIHELTELGFVLKIQSYSLGEPRDYIEASILLDDHEGWPRYTDIVGSFSIYMRGAWAGDLGMFSVSGVAVPVAIKLFGQSFERYLTINYDMNDPVKTKVWLERAAANIEKRKCSMGVQEIAAKKAGI